MISIIGCGNTNRSDDGAGVYVARKLLEIVQSESIGGVKVFDAGTSGMEVMFLARGSTALIIVDASNSGSEPGAIFEVPGEELSRLPEPAYNLHSFRWDNAIYAGRKIFKEDFPEQLSVFLIEAASLEYGLTLSEKIQSAADRVVELIVERLKSTVV